MLPYLLIFGKAYERSLSDIIVFLGNGRDGAFDHGLD